MKNFIEEHQIDTLFHFTRASNLPSIFRYGLLPRETIYRKGLNAELNDQYRYDECENAICMSIEFPNYKMFYRLRMEDQGVGWAVIKLDASILLDFECAFCVTNAGSEESYSIDLDKRMGGKALEKLYRDYPGKPSRSEIRIKKFYPTNPQAEVLVFGRVPLKYIKEVYFEDIKTLMEFKSSIPPEINARINTEYFLPREDWRFW